MTQADTAVAIDRLRELADAATPGEWTATTTGGKAAFVMAPHEDVGSVGVCRMDWTRGPQVAADNAAFIAAANPQAILSLITAYESQAERLRVVEGERNAYRTVAVNLGWNWNLCAAYGREEYQKHVETHVDDCAAPIIAALPQSPPATEKTDGAHS